MKNTLTKIIISGVVLVTGGSTVPLVPAEMKLMYSYRGDCVYEAQVSATTTHNDTRPYIPDCTKGEYAVSVFKDLKGNAVYKEIPLTQYQEMGEKDGVLKNPEKSELITILEAMTTKVEASIAYDNYDFVQAGGPVSSMTLTGFTTSGTDRLLTAGIHMNDLTDTITGVTYNGVALTEVAIGHASGAGGGGRTQREYLWYLVAPATGANNIVATGSGSITSGFDIWAVSYTGVDQTSPIDDSEKASYSGTTLSPSPLPTSSDANGWATSMLRNDGGSFTDSTNCTVRGSASSINRCDSNTVVGGTGSITVEAGHPSALGLIVTALIKPSAGAPIIPSTESLIIFEQ